MVVLITEFGKAMLSLSLLDIHKNLDFLKISGVQKSCWKWITNTGRFKSDLKGKDANHCHCFENENATSDITLAIGDRKLFFAHKR